MRPPCTTRVAVGKSSTDRLARSETTLRDGPENVAEHESLKQKFLRRTLASFAPISNVCLPMGREWGACGRQWVRLPRALTHRSYTTNTLVKTPTVCRSLRVLVVNRLKRHSWPDRRQICEANGFISVSHWVN